MGCYFCPIDFLCDFKILKTYFQSQGNVKDNYDKNIYIHAYFT
jgi:hypothetical protein